MKQMSVLTGDINSSTTIGRQKSRKLERTLRNSFLDLRENLPQIQADHFTCFRGDAWQLVVGRAEESAIAAVYFQASLVVHSRRELGVQLKSAIAIGFGSIEFFPDEISSAGGGEAYRLSGKGLDRIRRRIPGMNFTGLGEADASISVVLGLTDALVHRWTSSQAQAVCYALTGLTQNEIAARWKPEAVSQQAIHKHLQNAGWPAIEPALSWINTTIYSCICENNHLNEDTGKKLK